MRVWLLKDELPQLHSKETVKLSLFFSFQSGAIYFLNIRLLYPPSKKLQQYGLGHAFKALSQVYCDYECDVCYTCDF